MAIICNICCNTNQHCHTHTVFIDSRTSFSTFTYYSYLIKNPCAPKIQGQPPCRITSSVTYPRISHPITLRISLPKALTRLDLHLQEGRGVIAWKNSSLIFSAPSLNKHIFSHFISYFFLLFSQTQFSKCYRIVCDLVPALTSAVNFPLYTIYISDTNCSSVPFIIIIDSILW